MRVLWILAGLLVAAPAVAQPIQFFSAPGSSSITINTTPITGGTNGRLLFDNSGVVGEATVTYLSSIFKIGPDAAATPVTQSLTFGNVTAGTSNTAGATNLIDGSQGTGTGVGGSLQFQTAGAGSTGSAQNTLRTALTVDAIGTGAGTAGNVIAANALSSGGAVFNGSAYSGSGFILGRSSIPILEAIYSGARQGYLFWNNNSFLSINNASAATPSISMEMGSGVVGIGGATSSVPALGASGTTLLARLGDNSADTAFRALTVQTPCVLIANLPAAGVAGRRDCVTNGAAVPVFLGTVSSTGSTVAPVFDNGASWVYG